MEVLMLPMEQYQEIIQKLDILAREQTNKTNLGSLMTGKQLCEMLDVSPRTLQNYRDKGIIKFSQVGRKIYYTMEDVEIFIQMHKMGRNG